MKRSLCLLLLLSGCCLTSFAQRNYEGYFRSILQVEEKIASEDFRKAVQLYQQLFDRYDRVFARDAYNACVLSAFADTSRFRYFYYKCAVAGVPWQTMVNTPYINRQLTGNNADSLFLSGRKVFWSSIDTSLRKEFLSRYKEEQDSKAARMPPNAFRETVQANFDRIRQLALAGRFPDEQRIGTNDLLENSMLNATMKHYPWSVFLLDTVIRRSLKEGGMQPLCAAILYGFNQTRTGVLYKSTPCPDSLYFLKCYNLPFGKYSQDIEQVDCNRSEMFICSLATERKLNEVSRRYDLRLKWGY